MSKRRLAIARGSKAAARVIPSRPSRLATRDPGPARDAVCGGVGVAYWKQQAGLPVTDESAKRWDVRSDYGDVIEHGFRGATRPKDSCSDGQNTMSHSA